VEHSLSPVLLPLSTPTTMSGHAELPLSVNIPNKHENFLREVRENTYNILSLDPATRTLSLLKWYVVLLDGRLIVGWWANSFVSCSNRPVIDQKRVVPSELRDHRLSHRFLGPCCLCPLFAQNDRAVFVEAAILIETSGPFSGRYIAKCAEEKCGYLGRSLYSKIALERTRC